jgi:hypothetical protein
VKLQQITQKKGKMSETHFFLLDKFYSNRLQTA